jgi:hypothetical protein
MTSDSELIALADEDVYQLLGHLVRAHPGHALNVLLETGAIEQCGWYDERAEDLYSLRLNPTDQGDPPVYRVVPKTEETSDG